MSYVYYDLPADSAELETFNGYYVARAPQEATGYAPERPDYTTGPDELRLSLAPLEATMPVPLGERLSPLRLVDHAPFKLGKFMSNLELAGMFVVPSLCFVTIWLIGHFW